MSARGEASFDVWSSDLGVDEPDARCVSVNNWAPDRPAYVAENAAKRFVSDWFYADPTGSAQQTVEGGVTVFVRDTRERPGSDTLRFRVSGEISMDWHASEENEP